MDISAIKEMIDWFLMRACLLALAALSGLFLFAVLSRALVRLKSAAKRYGWPIVTLFIVFSSWATYTAFPTAEEKNGNVANVGMLPITNTNYQFGNGEQGTGNGEEGTENTNSTVHLNSSPSPKLSPNSSTLTPNSSPLSLTQEDFARGFVLTRIGTNELHDFTSPLGASICEDWKAFGAAEDWVYLRGLGNGESIPRRPKGGVAEGDALAGVGTGNGDFGAVLRVHSDGWMRVLSPTSSVFAANEYFPFKTTMGIVPEANWHLLTNTIPRSPIPVSQSQFWHYLTTSNTLQLTWQNALYNRESDMPISVQAEFYENGDFTYRYDLSAIKSKIDSGVIPENFPSNIIIGTIPHSLLPVLHSPFPTSFTFRHLEPSDVSGGDRDGDGLIIEDELFVYHTDPYNADSDYDGLSDYDEIFIVKSNPLDAYSISNDYYDGLASVLNGEDTFSYPQGSTNSVLEHVFYSGSTNGVFSLPVPTDETAVLKVSVSGSGIGRLVVGEKVVPLVAPMKQRSVAVTNTLLLAVGKGVKKSIWFTKPDGLELAIDSDDFMIGELPSLLWPHGWIAFPHTEATVPCIHDFYGKGRLVTLLHGEEFPGMTASWSSGTCDVVITNVVPVSAEIYGHFKKNQTREISYRVNHPKQLNTAIAHFTQTLRFCPQFTEDEEPPEESPEEDQDEKYFDCMCGVNAPCFCGEDEWCFCHSPDCRCNENRSPTITDNEDDEVEFENILETLMPSVNALYLYRDNERIVNLEVPDGEPRHCCPCPEHWKSNYVSKVLYTSRLSVNDAAGDDFNISYEPCSVTVSGVSPSRSFRDSTVNFITNGVTYKRLDYTVLGVKISRGEWDVPFETYNRLSPQLGFPFEVCTNINNADVFYLNTDVLMTNGYVRISLEDVTGEFKIWLPGWSDAVGNWHDYEVLLDSETKRVRYMSMGRWKNILRRYWETTSLEVRVTSSAAGSCKLKLEYLASDGDSYIHDFAEQRITSVNPPVRFDLTRDGALSEEDINAFLSGRIFRYWTNEDTVKGDCVGADDDDDPNINDDVVNGTYDLVNFFPAALDFRRFVEAWGSQVKYIIKSSWDNEAPFNVCFANLAWEKAGEIQTTNVTTTTGMALSSAQLISLDRNGIEIPYDMLVQFSQNSGVMICEALKPNRTIYVDIKFGDEVLYTYTAPMDILSVKDMYNWYNFRSFSGDNSGRGTEFHTMWDEDYDKSLIFLHGANVSSADAEKWGDVIFKRMWLSGMRARFYNVDWKSDIGSSANYHENASNAFVVASQIVSTIDSIPGEKIIMAHSLGNMVVSSMIQDYGLEVSKYLMCNSAVPAEAYDTTMTPTNVLIHKDWNEYPRKSFANEWYRFFEDDLNDDRRLLTWGGRFADVADCAINFYSTGDHVLELYYNNNLWATDGYENWNQKFERYCWHKQELWKGRKGIVSLMGTTDWAGWSFRENLLGYNTIQPTNAWLMSDAELKTNTVFKIYPASMNTNSIPLLLRGAILTKGIPSRTPSSGATKWGAGSFERKMYALEQADEEQNGILRPNGWISRRNGPFDDWGERWLHSDMKDMAYFYVFKLYEKFTEVGDLK